MKGKGYKNKKVNPQALNFKVFEFSSNLIDFRFEI